MGRNAFYASFIIRNVPSAPFIVVNMAFGAARANFAGYLAGCALGVLPKTALVAFFGGSFMAAVAGDGVWTNLPATVTTNDYNSLTRQVRITLSARASAANLQGQTTASGGPNAVRGQLTTTVTPRAAFNELQMGSQIR